MTMSSLGLGVKVFKGLSIGDALGYLRTIDPNAEIFHHINIVTGRLGSRGTNFVSTPDYKWHLTHELLQLSTSASSDDLIQSIRLFGCYNDSIPLVLGAHQKEINNLRDAYKTQKTLLDGAVEQDEDELMIDAIPKVPINKAYLPGRKLCKKSKYILNTIHPDNQSHEGYIVNVSIDLLSRSDKIIYEKLISLLSNEYDSGSWHVQSEILSHFTGQNEVQNLIWHWHKQNSKHPRTNNENENGLLFKKSGLNWSVRYNRDL